MPAQGPESRALSLITHFTPDVSTTSEPGPDPSRHELGSKEGSRYHPAQKQRLGSRPHNEKPGLPGSAAREHPSRIAVLQRGLLFGEGTPVATRDVFSEDELAKLRGFPEPARAELVRYFTLAPADEAFVRKFRGRDNVLGAAMV